jgi:uncharacterized protein YcbK (DUF882 family)
MSAENLTGLTPPQMRRRDALLALGFALVLPPTAFAAGIGMRRLKLKHAHTGDTFDGPYRDAQGLIPAAMADLAIFLRDHHNGTVGPLHVETLDILSDVLTGVGQTRATVLSAYRTKRTNRMLAARLFGVAEKSQHLKGRAIDITLDARLSDAVKFALSLQRGGVGWYPKSHFLHIDSGPVRSWTMGGVGLTRAFRIEDILSGAKAPRPLTVQERLRLHRALAKKQWRERR